MRDHFISFLFRRLFEVTWLVSGAEWPGAAGAPGTPQHGDVCPCPVHAAPPDLPIPRLCGPAPTPLQPALRALRAHLSTGTLETLTTVCGVSVVVLRVPCTCTAHCEAASSIAIPRVIHWDCVIWCVQQCSRQHDVPVVSDSGCIANRLCLLQ